MGVSFVFFFQAEDGIRDVAVTGVQTCALPISVGTHGTDATRRALVHCSPRDPPAAGSVRGRDLSGEDRKSTRLNSSHGYISYAVFCLKKKTTHREGSP